MSKVKLSLQNSCPVLDKKEICRDCPQVERQWDLEQLWKDLKTIKGKELTSTEKCWLSLFLKGIDFEQIVERFHYQSSIKSRFSRSIYSYVAALTNKKVNHWACIPFYLNEYRKDTSDSSNETIEIKIKISADLDRETINKIFDGLKQVCGVDSLRIDRVEKLDESDEQ